MKSALRIVKMDEGFESSPYYCTKMFPTIGFGFRIVGNDGKLLPAGAPLPKITMTEAQACEKLEALLESYVTQLKGTSFSKLNDVRQGVILSMCHQLGVNGCLKFRKMWAAIDAGYFTVAAREILDSEVARDQFTAGRMKRNSEMMQTGILHSYYL